MKFRRIPSPVPDMQIWGAHKGSFTFVISNDLKYEIGYRASVKTVDAVPFDGTRYDLDDQVYETLEAAISACKKFLRERH